MAIHYDFEQPLSGVDLGKRWVIAAEANGNHILRHVPPAGISEGHDSVAFPCPTLDSCRACLCFKGSFSFGLGHFSFRTSDDMTLDVCYGNPNGAPITQAEIRGGLGSAEGDWRLLDLNIGSVQTVFTGSDFGQEWKMRPYALAIDGKLRARGNIWESAALASLDDPPVPQWVFLDAQWYSKAEVDDLTIGMTPAQLEDLHHFPVVSLSGEKIAAVMDLMPWNDVASGYAPGEGVLFGCSLPAESLILFYRMDATRECLRRALDELSTVQTLHIVYVRTEDFASLLVDALAFRLHLHGVNMEKHPVVDLTQARKELARLLQADNAALLLQNG